MRTYFITGATGTVGSAIAELLLREQNVRIRLLIRARDLQHLKERLQWLCRFWQLDHAAVSEQVKVFRGDMSLDLFGLEHNVYTSLVRECTHIIHCGGMVRMNLPLEDARKAALKSARNIIAFAEDCRKNRQFQKTEFISTVGVAGRFHGVVPEQWITRQRSFHNTYEQAKAEAEAFMVDRIEAGLPITVHRPSMVVGDSRTGKISHFKVFYHLCEFLSGRRTRGLMPRLRGVQLDTVPVDYVAEVIVRSSTLQEWSGQILHLCSGPDSSMEVPTLIELVRQEFSSRGVKVPKCTMIPLSIFKRSVPLLKPLVPAMTKRALNALPYFLTYLEEKQSFANAETLKLAGPTGIELPAPERYLRKVLQYYLAKSSVSKG